MKSLSLTLIFLSILSGTLFSQKLKIENSEKDKLISGAFDLAIWTLNKNTHDGILAAGGDYGGEWARDASINSWCGVSLIKPDIAENTLWGVTINRDTVGHQYWDKILWVIATWNHYVINGDKEFLEQVYKCSRNTFAQLEKITFDTTYGLFKGPSVAGDGISAYPEPPFNPTITASSVLRHPGTREIKVFSTNTVYYGAYLAIAKMAAELKRPDEEIKSYEKKANALKENINKYFWREKQGKYSFLILKDGKTDTTTQESQGITFALLFNLLSEENSQRLINNTVETEYGIPYHYPHFKRYSDEKPGRHDNIVWPLTMGYWADATAKHGRYDLFVREMELLAHLTMDEDKGNGNFKEMYDGKTGKPHGGWQSDVEWKSCDHNTWCATAYIRIIINDLLGFEFTTEGINFKPYIPQGYGKITFTGLKYRDMTINLTLEGNGENMKYFTINGKSCKEAFIPANLKGEQNITIVLNN